MGLSVAVNGNGVSVAIISAVGVHIAVSVSVGVSVSVRVGISVSVGKSVSEGATGLFSGVEVSVRVITGRGVVVGIVGMGTVVGNGVSVMFTSHPEITTANNKRINANCLRSLLSIPQPLFLHCLKLLVH